MMELSGVLSAYNRTTRPPLIDPNLFKDDTESTTDLFDKSRINLTTEPNPVNLTTESNPVNLTKEPNLTSDMEKLGVGSFVVNSGYGTMKVTLTSTEKEIERVKNAMNKKLSAYKYYSFVGAVGTASLAVFVTGAISGVFGPATSTIGILMSLTAIAGTILDWKDWAKKNAH